MIRKSLLLPFLATIVLGTPLDYYVSPAGTPKGTGSIASPWDLATALSGSLNIPPGATIWLRGGTYGSSSTIFTSKLAGTAERPIIVRQFPGERATIDGSIAIYGPYTWYWGFEVTNSNPDRKSGRPECIDAYDGSRGIKLINLVLHDCAQGIGLWKGSIDSEATGNIIYYTGEPGTTRGHGHGIYTQNLQGIKHIRDNIIFDTFDIGIQVYGSEAAFIEGFDFDGNTVVDSGSLYGRYADNLILAGGHGVDKVTIRNTYTYYAPPSAQGHSRFGWEFPGDNRSIVSRNNYWIGGSPAIEVWKYKSVIFEGNVTYAPVEINVLLNTGTREKPAGQWDNNAYYGSQRFRFNKQTLSFSDWKKVAGLDRHSTAKPGRPTGTWVFVRPNAYEPGRANIVIYNWALRRAIRIVPKGILARGDRYVVRNAFDFLGAPVLRGVYDGRAINIPMDKLTVARPVGHVPHQPASTAPAFGVFVLMRPEAARGTAPRPATDGESQSAGPQMQLRGRK